MTVLRRALKVIEVLYDNIIAIEVPKPNVCYNGVGHALTAFSCLYPSHS